MRATGTGGRGRASHPLDAPRALVLLSSAKDTELLIHVNKTYINLTQPSIGGHFGLGVVSMA